MIWIISILVILSMAVGFLLTVMPYPEPTPLEPTPIVVTPSAVDMESLE
jgi:hypothetical protein